MNALLVYVLVGFAMGLIASRIRVRPAMGPAWACLFGAIGGFIGGVVGSYDVPEDQFMVARVAGVACAGVGASVTLALALFARDGEASGYAPLARKKKRDPHWSAGLLSSDRRSFETISKLHQRNP